MIELIVIVIIIVSVASNMKKKKPSSGSHPAKTRPVQPKSRQPVRTQPQVQTPERRSVQTDAAPLRSARNTGERYDDWFPVPDGKTVVRCHYCGADNLIPDKSNPQYYSCYFCREDL